MADTIQSVRWFLGDATDKQQHLWMPSGRERPYEVIEESIRRLDIDGPLRDAFPYTEPRWYGFWIESPLTKTQVDLLSVLFADVVAAVPRYAEALADFRNDLAQAKQTGEQLHVELIPPGHVDFGFVTTFVHCPRCKAEGPCERWRESYPVEPVLCPVCGHSYSPASTFSMEAEFASRPIECPACHTVHRGREYSPETMARLETLYTYRELRKDLYWLERVADFYERYPEQRDAIKPSFIMLLESDDLEVQDDLAAGVPFDEIKLPTSDQPSSQLPRWSNEDEEVVDYLKHHAFSLEKRLSFVRESLDTLAPMVQSHAIPCLTCGSDLRNDK